MIDVYINILTITCILAYTIDIQIFICAIMCEAFRQVPAEGPVVFKLEMLDFGILGNSQVGLRDV
jgi:hypothetical protein